MRLYTPFFPPPGADPEQPPVMVRDGFSVWGLLFGWIVFLRPGSWLCAALGCAATVLALSVARHLSGGWVLLAGLHLLVGAFAAECRAWELRQGGWVAGPVVAGMDRGHALLRLVERRPELVGRAA